MSMGGTYVAIPEEKLNEALYDDGASLSRFVLRGLLLDCPESGAYIC